MKKGVKLLILLLLGTFVTFIACSDSSTDSNLTEGDPEDPDFIQAKGLADAYVDTLFSSFEMVFGYMSFDGSEPLSAVGDSLNINYDLETCWWEIYASSDSTDYSLVFIDSVKFDDGTGCQMLPDSLTTTQIEYRAYLDLSAFADSDSLVVDAEEEALVTGIQSDQVVVNAANSTYMDLVLGLLSMTVDYEGTIADLTFNREDLEGEAPIYPLSGSASVAMTIEGSTQEGSGSGTWSVYVTFYEEHYHARAESGDNYWEWDVYYTGPA